MDGNGIEQGQRMGISPTPRKILSCSNPAQPYMIGQTFFPPSSSLNTLLVSICLASHLLPGTELEFEVERGKYNFLERGKYNFS